MRDGGTGAAVFKFSDAVLGEANPERMLEVAKGEVLDFFDNLPPDGRRFFEIPEDGLERHDPARLMTLLVLLVHWRRSWDEEFRRTDDDFKRGRVARRRQLNVVREAIEFGIQSKGGRPELCLYREPPSNRVKAIWYSAAGEITLHDVLIACHIESRDQVRTLHDLALRLTLHGGTSAPLGVVGGRCHASWVADTPTLDSNPLHMVERATRWAYARKVAAVLEAAVGRGDSDTVLRTPFNPAWHTPSQPPEDLQKAALCGVAYLIFNAFAALSRGMMQASNSADLAGRAIAILLRSGRFAIEFELNTETLGFEALVRDSQKDGAEVLRCTEADLQIVMGGRHLKSLRRNAEQPGAAEFFRRQFGVGLVNVG